MVALFASVTVIMSATVGCTDKGKIEDADRRQAQASQEIEKASQLQKKYEQELKDAEAKAAENKRVSDELNEKIQTWNENQASREQALIALQEKVTSEQKDLKSLTEQRVSLEAYISTEKTRIENERAKIAVDKKAAVAELARLTADNEKQIQTKTEKNNAEIAAKNAQIDSKAKSLEEQIKIADQRDAELETLQSRLEEQQAALKTSEEVLAKLKVSLNEKTTQLEEAVKTTREFFMKSSLGDIFDRINADERFVFLVRVVGFGSEENITHIRSSINALMDDSNPYKKLQNVTKFKKSTAKTDKAEAKSVYTAEDSLLVDVKAVELRQVREKIEKYLNEKSKSGESRAYNSLWVVIRPVEQVRVGMKMVVYGSTAKYYDGRNEVEIASFENIRTPSQKVLNLKDLDLTKPGSYLFKSSASASSCEMVTVECMETMAQEGLLEAQQSMTLTSASGTRNFTGSYREILMNLIAGSIDQSRQDLKERTVLGVKLDKFDNPSFTFDSKAILEQVGFADRAPVISKISIKYSVSMVEKINHVANDMDTYSFVKSGVMGNTAMFDLTDGQRGEITIPLPITQYSESTTNLKDLSLVDFSPSAEMPKEADEYKSLSSKWAWQLSVEEKARLAELERKNLEEKIEKAGVDVREQKESEFENRTFSNAGILQLMANALMGN